MSTEPTDFVYPSAYPNEIEFHQFHDPRYGLTKREHFAAMAMQAFVTYGGGRTSFQTVAEDAVRQADALIVALNDPAARKETP